MKRALIALVIFSMILSFSSVASFADNEPLLSVTTESANPGDTVTLVVSVENNPGVFNMTIPVEYDENVLENPEFSGVGEGWTIGSKAYWENGSLEDSTYNGDTLMLTFHVKDGANAGMTTVSLGTIDAWNTNEQRVSFATTTGGINVNAAAAPAATTSPAVTSPVATSPAQSTYDAVPQTGVTVNPVIWVVLVVGCVSFAGFLIFSKLENAKE